MNRKEKFLHAVRILAPDDDFILKTAQQVQEDALPAAPGGVALEFVVALKNMPQRTRRALELAADDPLTKRKASAFGGFSLRDFVRIKRSEERLKFGDANHALEELAQLPYWAWMHPWVLKTRAAAHCASREQKEIFVQE